MIDISQDHLCTQRLVRETFAPCILESDVHCNLADKFKSKDESQLEAGADL